MTFELKTLSPDAVSRALAKAERYRLLNERVEAESICFGEDLPSAVTETLQVVAQLRDPYEQAYYSGIIWERRAKAHLHRGSMGLGPQVYACLREAMAWYERAEAIRPPGNDDPLLRWNACARSIMRDPRLTPPVGEERGEPLFLE